MTPERPWRADIQTSVSIEPTRFGHVLYLHVGVLEFYRGWVFGSRDRAVRRAQKILDRENDYQDKREAEALAATLPHGSQCPTCGHAAHPAHDCGARHHAPGLPPFCSCNTEGIEA